MTRMDDAIAGWPSKKPGKDSGGGRIAGRTKRRLGEVFALANFGVNLTTLAPGASAALRHAHRNPIQSKNARASSFKAIIGLGGGFPMRMAIAVRPIAATVISAASQGKVSSRAPCVSATPPIHAPSALPLLKAPILGVAARF